jgi:ADP-ribose pyrophosphatase YjhB (NUDIX family)
VPATRVAAYCVCVDADARMLLVRLNDLTTRPGAWTLPGGGIEFGEHPEVAAIRELEEETGYIGEIAELLGVNSHTRTQSDVPGDEYHSVQIVYRVAITGGTLRHEPPGNSSDHAAWHPRAELSSLDVVGLVAYAIPLAYRE